MKKLCCDCNTEKDISEFNKQPDRKYGVAGRCRECQSIYHKQWYTKNKERMKERFRRNNYFSRYNITIADYEKLLEKQNNSCAICYSKTGSANKRLAVDHNHQTGIIRGLLCDECNTGLGKFKDNPSLLTNAIAYLIKN
jgi:hypothetical protein